MKTAKIITSALAALVICDVAAQAQSFTYNSGDLLAAFRKSGSADDLIVDLGSASTFQNATGSMSISGVNSALLTSVFGNLDGIYWSVFGYVGTTGSPLGSQNTLFVTDPRSGNISTPNDPNSSLTSSGQRQVISKMTAIADGATSLYATVLANQIVEVSSSLNVGGDPISYTVGIGSQGDFNGTWSPDPENLTPTGFATSGNPSVSDLFQQNPGAANSGTYLGDFVLGQDGSLTFNSVSSVPEPSTWAMLGTGAMALFAIGRSRRNK
jgi:hypothetical protein